MPTDPVLRSYAQPHVISPATRQHILAQSPLAFALAPEIRTGLDEHLSAWRWAAGDPLFLAGVEAAGCYLIVSGRVRLARGALAPTLTGRDITIDVSGPGEVIGPLGPAEVSTSEALIADVSAWAMEEVSTLLVPSTLLRTAVDLYPDLAEAVERIRTDRQVQAEELEQAHFTATVEQRVGSVLRYLNDKFGQELPDGTHLLQARILREDLADLAGTTEDAAATAMSRMRRSGLIDAGHDWVLIRDAAGLTELIREG